MATTCAVKLLNTVVEKATIAITDGHKILDAEHSNVKELDMSMTFQSSEPAELVDAPVLLDASEINVTEIDCTAWAEFFNPEFVEGNNNSKSFFTSIIGGAGLEADPTWTYNTDETITYGNSLSYNVRPLDYLSFEANQFQFWSGDGNELSVGIILVSMGSATTIRATAEWQDRNNPGWNLMEVDGGGDTFVDITGLVGEYEALFSDFLPGCGNYDIRVTLVDNDEPRTTIQLEENPNNLQCG